SAESNDGPSRQERSQSLGTGFVRSGESSSTLVKPEIVSGSKERMFSPTDQKPVLIMAEPMDNKVSFAKEPLLLVFPKHDTERKYPVVLPLKSSAISPLNGLQFLNCQRTAKDTPFLCYKLLWLRSWFVPSQVTPSLYPHISPASCEDMLTVSPSASQKISQVRHMQSDITYHTTSKPHTSTVKGPTTSHPSPTDQTQVGERSPFSPGLQPVAPIPTGTFKCRHPGCTAGPFHTQHLMNSHAYVYSQDRPHFCPVEGCAQGVGGKGFKRKNEVVWHGLVHNSPGYICPFCPDQGRKYKYPRPDNLQRHVRVHHINKSNDDPQLRDVLSQRPEGWPQGRRY
ncbi:hypothetical protein GB937_010595, partial [Aspergillus fischeri]